MLFLIFLKKYLFLEFESLEFFHFPICFVSYFQYIFALLTHFYRITKNNETFDELSRWTHIIFLTLIEKN